MIANSDKTVREALDQGILQNETLAYFLARTYQFLLDVGINPSGIRFRQHRSNEMAHYANDCWDAEIETSYGWIEVAGHSDRSAFDLTKHQEKTKIELMAARPLKTPIQKQITHVVLDKQACGKEFKKDNAKVVGYFENLSADEKKEHAVKFAENGKTMVINAEGVEFSLTEKHLSFNEETVTIQEEKYIPHVIEPSFGVGRIVYSIFEHCFKVREKDAQRTYFDFPVHISPFKCSLLPLQNHAGLNQIVKDVKKLLIQHGITNKVDDSGQSIGKRYARTDECGIPYAITVDFDTINDQTVTLRQLDSMLQVRLPIADLPLCLNQLIAQTLTWQSVIEKYGLCDTSAQDAN